MTAPVLDRSRPAHVKRMGRTFGTHNTKMTLNIRTQTLLISVLLACIAPVWSAPPPQPSVHPSQPTVSPFKVVAEPFPHPNENWATPTLSKTTLTPAKAFVVQTDDRPTFVRQLLRVQWRQNDPIDLYVVRPKRIARPPTVLYLYSYPTDTHRFLLDSYCQRITQNGCAAVGFDSALTGGRYHDRPMREWFVSQLNESLAESAHDVQYVLDYLQTRGDLDMAHVGMFGQGSGGAIALLAAGADPRIQALDLLNPWGDWPDWLQQSALVPQNERPSYLTPAFTHRVAGLDPLVWLPRLKSCHIRLLQFTNDKDVPFVCQEKLAKAAPAGTEIKSYPTALNAYGVYSGGRLFQWLGRQLRVSSAPASPSPMH